MTRFAGLLVLVSLLLGCKKDIQNKEAIRQAVIDHLAKRPDLMAMDVRVDGVQFKQDEAIASVYLQAKSGAAAGGGMQMTYALERKGNQWVVKDKKNSGGAASPHGGATGNPPPALPPLPPGHPQIPDSSGQKK